ncbi:MAG: NADH-quinone oxidoreductase subunit M [Candidatus Bathyarchaeota archaeon]|jgi:NADH-quinone oxidoreductase subunit M
MIPHAALLATVSPGITGILIYALRNRMKRWTGILATIAASISVLMIASMSRDLIESWTKDGIGLLFSYSWVRPLNLDFSFLVDVVSLPIALIIAAISMLSCIYSLKYMEGKENQGSYYADLLLFMTGMIGVIFSANLIQFYLFWELMLIPSYLLIVNWGTSEDRLRIGFKYFIFTHIGALSMLLGIVSIFSYTETFNLLDLARPEVVGTIPPHMVIVIFVMLLIGFLVKMAAFPFHTWLPDAHSEAPTPVSAMLSGLMLKCGAYGFARILLITFGFTTVATSNYLTILAVITMAYGGLMALAQTDIKRLLAYSSISQMGYILFGLGAVYYNSSSLGIMGSLFHIVNHALCKSLLFLSAGVIIRQTKTRDINSLGGLVGKMPTTAIVCLIGAFSLIGTPPLNGFWSEWMIFGGGLASDKGLITIFAVLSTAITAGYYLWFAWRVFFGETPENLNDVTEGPFTLLIPLIILATLTVLLGVLPGLVLEYLGSAAEYLSSFLTTGS